MANCILNVVVSVYGLLLWNKRHLVQQVLWREVDGSKCLVHDDVSIIEVEEEERKL